MRSNNITQKLLALFKSDFVFFIGLALALVCVRLALFDFHTYFLTRYVPNSDMYQGASFFTTSMHSIRLDGTIAWWNSIWLNGFAQYYQAFLTPLAPTPGNIVYILWAQFIILISKFGGTIPEYFQYLIVNYLIFPFLTFLSFGYFSKQIFRSRYSIILISIVYAFSSMGLWNSAWFYFQEPFTLYFLLGSFLSFIQKPGRKIWLTFLIAVLIQIASLNYWTLFNSWFILLVIITYLLFQGDIRYDSTEKTIRQKLSEFTLLKRAKI